MPAWTAMPAVAAPVPDQRAFWDRWHQEHSVASHTEHSKAATQAFVSALPTGRSHVLELGCGQGREAVGFAQHGLRVSALDYSPVAIVAAKAVASKGNLRVDFRQHDLSRFPFPYGSGTFTGIFSHLSLHYFDDSTTRAIFEEIRRILKPRGALYFTVRSILDPLYGEGTPVGRDMFCRKGHVRHFFHKEYISTILAAWDIKYADYYDTSEETVNPGVFMRVLAYAPGDRA